FGMKESDTSKLDPEMENQWLNSVYEFENKFKDAKRITLYEFIGKPEFRSLENEKLSEGEIAIELERIYKIMEENSIRLDAICEYENKDELLYRFITEELFNEEIDDMRIDGMNHCFIYEEFHPNHKYDLTQDSENFLYNVFESQLEKDFYGVFISDSLKFSDQNYTKEEFIKLIRDFQNKGISFKFNSKEVKDVEFDLDKRIANVSGIINYTIYSKNFSGNFKFDFVLDDCGYWELSKIELPEDILNN
ncbi:MAG TPA: hypothetical protein PKC58_17850, partial [Ignavibacteria bacterium]|nr:hypothetical protein [Ignavibacteria bacterium]